MQRRGTAPAVAQRNPGPGLMLAAALVTAALLTAGCAATGAPGAAPASTTAAGSNARSARPNIVLIVSDDQGYGDLSCYGATDIRTPMIDYLAVQGVRFTQFYSNGPECTPTRTALLSGRYQQRVGGLECAIGTDNVGRYDDAIRLAEQHDLGLPASVRTVPRMLKDAGYATCVAGKWHLGYEDKFQPARHGFDHAFYVQGGNCDFFQHQETTGRDVLALNGKLIRREGHMTDLITDEAVEFIDAQALARGGPFFLYVPFTAPHAPYQGPNDYTGKLVSEQDWNKGTRAKYAEMVEHMDTSIGRILDALDRRGMADNTLVIFFSDNGGVGSVASNAPFSGTKGGLFEGGIRVPCIMRWPGKLPAGAVSDQVTISMDLSASIVRAAGLPIPRPPDDQPFDGIDILRLVQEHRPAFARTLYWRARRGQRTWRALRSGDLKYIERQDDQQMTPYLFDLGADPAEKSNLLAQRPAEAQRLKAMLTVWEQEVQPTR